MPQLKVITVDNKILFPSPNNKTEEYRVNNCCLDIPLSDIRTSALRLDFETAPKRSFKLIIEWALKEKNKKGKMILQYGVWQMLRIHEKGFIVRGETVLPELNKPLMINAILFNLTEPTSIKFIAQWFPNLTLLRTAPYDIHSILNLNAQLRNKN